MAMAASLQHAVLLTSNGTAVACGYNEWGQCNIPPLDEGMSYSHTPSYTEFSAGGIHTVLLRSDGTAVACGDNRHGQCNIPSLESSASRRYICHVSYPVRVSQLDFVCQDGAFDADVLEFGRA